MILLNDEYVTAERADSCCLNYLLGEIDNKDNKIQHQGRYKIISYKVYNTGNVESCLVSVFNTVNKYLSALPVL